MKSKTKIQVIVGTFASIILLVLVLFGIKMPTDLAEQLKEFGIMVPEEFVQETQSKDPALAGLPNTPKTFTTAKNILYKEIYQGQAITFYCGCAYDTDSRQVNLESCGYQIASSETRAKRIEAEHIVPAYAIGQHRTCWREPICTDKEGKTYKGRSCCEEIDPVFHTAHNDLHNLVPAIGEVNGDRSNYRFGMISGEERRYGQCDFEVDKETRRAEPPPEVRGNIARIYFYIEDTYNINLSDSQRQLFTAWNKEDPVDKWELERDKRIEKTQGNYNKFVREYQE